MKIKPHEWVEKFGCSSAHIEVLLDDVVQRDCVEADDERGYVVRLMESASSINHTERVTGRVEFRPKQAFVQRVG